MSRCFIIPLHFHFCCYSIIILNTPAPLLDGFLQHEDNINSRLNNIFHKSSYTKWILELIFFSFIHRKYKHTYIVYSRYDWITIPRNTITQIYSIDVKIVSRISCSCRIMQSITLTCGKKEIKFNYSVINAKGNIK